jgi:hypothetical protein
MVDISSQVLSQSNFAAFEPVAINDLGEIVGEGALLNGDVHVVVLQPCGSDCGAPVASNPNSALRTSPIPGHSRAMRDGIPKSAIEAIRAQISRRYRAPRLELPKK